MKEFFTGSPDDPVFYAMIGFLMLVAAGLLVFMFWLTGMMVWTGNYSSEPGLYWPGAILSFWYTLTGLGLFIAAVWLFWRFGKLLQAIVKGFTGGDNDT